MPFPPTSGGNLWFRYANATDAHMFSVDVLPFDSATLAYTGAGAKPTTEPDIHHTAHAFAAYWARYYGPAWMLAAVGLWQNTGENGLWLPDFMPVALAFGNGSDDTTPTPTLERIFDWRTTLGNTERLRFHAIVTNYIAQGVAVTALAGGFDSRDRDLIGYLSGTDTACVCWDGQPFPPSARVRIHFDAPPQGTTGPAPTLPDGLMVSG